MIEKENGENPGRWTKWVRARLSPPEAQTFEKLREELDIYHDMRYISDNMVMRFLGALDFDHGLSLERIK